VSHEGSHEGGFEQVTLAGKRGYFGWAFDENPEQVSSEGSHEGGFEQVTLAGKRGYFGWAFDENP